jgi:hypothetical protein
MTLKTTSKRQVTQSPRSTDRRVRAGSVTWLIKGGTRGATSVQLTEWPADDVALMLGAIWEVNGLLLRTAVKSVEVGS